MVKITKKVGDKDILEAATCNYCKKRLKASPDGNGTSALLRHLQKHCPKASLEAKQIGKGQQLLTLGTEGSPKPYSYNKEIQKVWLEVQTELLIESRGSVQNSCSSIST
ncbi:unnamed protein product [Cuscuta epithymum]|uniref:BED-type domain-containing protein n=1 Tax=Cuscuta epithymum TaxID=186058 RepID=A0AAV0EAY0_9ASTE|nr:unnamed protein product [Cuscuta epithymum]